MSVEDSQSIYSRILEYDISQTNNIMRITILTNFVEFLEAWTLDDNRRTAKIENRDIFIEYLRRSVVYEKK